MDARAEKRHQRDRPDFRYRVRGQQFRRWKMPGDPHLYRQILSERHAVDYQHRYLVLGVETQELRGFELTRAGVEILQFKIGAGFGERDERHRGTGLWCVTKCESHGVISGAIWWPGCSAFE